MKRFLSFIFAVVLSISGVMLGFACKNNSNDLAVAAATKQFKEEDLKNKEYIVNPEALSGTLSNNSKSNLSLFDEDTETFRPGKIVVPSTTGSYKEVSSSYQVSQFSLGVDDSIFMWIFIPDDEYYNLKVSFVDNNQLEISWFINNTTLDYWIKNKVFDGTNYGWRLFEFCVSDATMNGEVANALSSINFKVLKIDYYSEDDAIVQNNDNSFAFYSIYKAASFSNYSQIVDGQDYTVYKYNDDYLREDSYFIDEELVFSSVKDIFEYLIVGQGNLKDYPNPNCSWEIVIVDPDGEEFKKSFNEKFIFEKQGYHSIRFKLNENRGNGSVEIMFFSIDVYAEYFVLGSFTNVDYVINVDEKSLIKFKISSYFEVLDEIEVELLDKTLATTTYYVKDGVCYIEISGVKEGDTKISVSAKGQKPGTYETKVFKASTAIEIKNPNKKSASEIFLWVILGIYGVGFAIFIVISLVKARRFGVK